MLAIGYMAEGTDILILHYLVCRVVGLDEGAVAPLQHQSRPGKRGDVAERVRLALRKFYYRHAVAAVMEMDNDGQLDLRTSGAPEDPGHPRHWVHLGEERQASEDCRFCWLTEAAAATSPQLRTPHFVSGDEWGVVICVPTEAIEAWLMIAQGLTQPDNALLDAEGRPAGRGLKQAFYGYPYVTIEAVRTTALSVLRKLDDLSRIGLYARSFRLFQDQLLKLRPRIEAAARQLGARV